MDIRIREMTPQEQKYSYTQSSQIMGQTGCIGHLRGFFDGDGRDFQHTWDQHDPRLITDEFRDDFNEVFKALKSDKAFGGMLKSRSALAKYCNAHSGGRFSPDGQDFGMRADTGQYAYLLRLNPGRGEYNVYCYCYRADWLMRHMARAERGIRFITPNYDEKFRISDGDSVRITTCDGRSRDWECRYIDDYHFEIGSNANLYHIAEFAERMAHNGSAVIPLRSSLPERCHSVSPSTGELIRIDRGMDGFIPSNETRFGENSREAADRLNRESGITKAQEAAMLGGATEGWTAPAADPKNYDGQGQLRQATRCQRNNAR